MEKAFNQLIERYITGDFSPAEKRQFLEWIAEGRFNNELEQYIDTAMRENRFEIAEDPLIKELIYQRMRPSLTKAGDVERTPARVRSLSKWWWAAAAVLIIGSLMTIIITSDRRWDATGQGLSQKTNPNDIRPGGNKAVLTLADGTTITLDSAANGTLAQQGNVNIIKQANGEIVYVDEAKAGDKVMINTMSTPRGGQYQLRLPDGTMIWLNASSSVTYPSRFAGNERKIKITGEAYFEVAKDKSKPFKVDVDGKAVVEVLGTHFNINAYSNDDELKTTLLEGSVKVVLPDNNKILKPGQQAQIRNDAIEVSNDIDVHAVIAWKNGLFLLDNTSLQALMRQISRWYDVDIVYEGSIPERRFEGGVSKNLPLSGVLDLLKSNGIRFRLEGKKLVVQP